MKCPNCGANLTDSKCDYCGYDKTPYGSFSRKPTSSHQKTPDDMEDMSVLGRVLDLVSTCIVKTFGIISAIFKTGPKPSPNSTQNQAENRTNRGYTTNDNPSPKPRSEYEQDHQNTMQIDGHSSNNSAQPENRYERNYTYQSTGKNRKTALILCIFFGYWGFHYFYMGRIFMGLLYMMTFGFFGLGWFIDIIRILSGTFPGLK